MVSNGRDEVEFDPGLVVGRVGEFVHIEMAVQTVKYRATVKIILTGHSGFSGSHFRRIFPSIPLEDESGQPTDILDRGALTADICRLAPEAVVHLAARTFVPESFEDPHATFDVNVTGTLNLLSALKDCGFEGRMIFVGSAEVYGLVSPEELPVREEQPLRPRNPYAASKAAAEALAYQWSQTGGFEVVLARPFNHTGPGQSDQFVLSNFARQIAEIRLGRRKPVIEVGDIDVTRDFTDVRDVVRAYVLLLNKGKNGEVYNICSGQEHAIRSLLQELLAIVGLEVEIVTDGARLRPTEQRRMAGDYQKLRADTGWRPEIPQRQTLTDMLEDWETRLK